MDVNTVYIVMEAAWEGDFIVRVFKSKEVAEAFIQNAIPERSRGAHYIDDWEVSS